MKIELNVNEMAIVSIKPVRKYPTNIGSNFYELRTNFMNGDIKALILVRRYKRHPNKVYYYCYTIKD